MPQRMFSDKKYYDKLKDIIEENKKSEDKHQQEVEELMKPRVRKKHAREDLEK